MKTKPQIEARDRGDGFWQVDNVPILGTGIEYSLATGPTTFTETDLADAVAAMADPAIVAPRVKLGHASGYNEALVGDAEPAFGRVENLRLGDKNQTLYGDLVVPPWLGRVMGTAYPSRSIEGKFDVSEIVDLRTNVSTATGKTYKLVVSAVSALGVQWPGVSVLDDLPLWYGDEIPEDVEFDAATEAAISAGGGMPLRRKKIEADVDTSHVRRQFYADVAQGDRYWWWIRAERYGTDGAYLIAEDEDSGELYRIDINLSKDEVNFGDPVSVEVEYSPQVAAGMALADSSVAVHASRADTDGPVKSTQEGESSMDDAIRRRLAAAMGLPEDATEEQIAAKAESGTPQPKPDAGERPSPSTGNISTGPATPIGDEDALAEGETDNRSGVQDEENGGDVEAKSDTVRIDRATYEHLKAGADTALSQAEDQRKSAINDLVERAVQAGKFTPARREHYAKLLASDYEGGKQLIAELEENTVPLKLRGTGGGSAEIGEAEDIGLPLSWFPEIPNIRAKAASRQPVTHAKEG